MKTWRIFVPIITETSVGAALVNMKGAWKNERQNLRAVRRSLQSRRPHAKILPAVRPYHDAGTGAGTVAALGRTLKAAEKGGERKCKISFPVYPRKSYTANHDPKHTGKWLKMRRTISTCADNQPPCYCVMRLMQTTFGQPWRSLQRQRG